METVNISYVEHLARIVYGKVNYSDTFVVTIDELDCTTGESFPIIYKGNLLDIMHYVKTLGFKKYEYVTELELEGVRKQLKIAKLELDK